jgi:hypothetical protein
MARNLFSRFISACWLASVAMLVPLHVNAQVHAPFAPFTATLHPGSSTIFNTTQGFNGGRADFGGGWGYHHPTPGENGSTGLQTFSATFNADPGSVFTGVSLGFEGWSFSNPENSWIRLYLSWDVLAGSDSESGSWEFQPSGPTQGGGGGLGLPIPDSIVALGNVSSFTVQIRASIWSGGGGSFGDGKGASLGFSQFGVNTIYTEGNPVTTPIPEPEVYAMMGLGLGLLGWIGRRKRLQAA